VDSDKNFEQNQEPIVF